MQYRINYHKFTHTNYSNISKYEEKEFLAII